MPRKISGSAISMMEELTVAISMPSVVLDSAIHLYRDPAPAGDWVAAESTSAPPEKIGLRWRDTPPRRPPATRDPAPRQLVAIRQLHYAAMCSRPARPSRRRSA